ncbi:DUF3098 domain-containing protein [Nafulsella turpanensis]|uniref:DUF3098 domain-containing protein n=1 Tax=Nafulsella turpanensis TaxID=1265690 RepID=UPI00034BB4AA|nr:DUF3098 domain-containing protein [Nafulsella turpanensis]
MDNSKEKLAFDKGNYLLLLAGLLCLIVGLTLMAMDNEPHGFGVLGLTLGPIIIAIGFLIEIFAILYKGKSKQQE